MANFDSDACPLTLTDTCVIILDPSGATLEGTLDPGILLGVCMGVEVEVEVDERSTDISNTRSSRPWTKTTAHSRAVEIRGQID